MIETVIHNVEELTIVLDKIPGNTNLNFENIDYPNINKVIVTYIPENQCVYFHN